MFHSYLIYVLYHPYLNIHYNFIIMLHAYVRFQVICQQWFLHFFPLSCVFLCFNIHFLICSVDKTMQCNVYNKYSNYYHFIIMLHTYVRFQNHLSTMICLVKKMFSVFYYSSNLINRLNNAVHDLEQIFNSLWFHNYASYIYVLFQIVC